MFHILDLKFREQSETIAAFLLETAAGPVLFECGPHSTYPQLVQGLAALGYQPADIAHCFLTHIHLDHAGAAWALAKEGATIHVHPQGAKHLHDPERLWGSARRIYGEAMEQLWGLMEGIPQERLRVASDGESIHVGDRQICAQFTPGHAVHHIAWQVDEQLIVGDVAGVKIGTGPVVPPCPPPDIHIEDWLASIERIRQLKPQAIWLTHYGKVEAVDAHLDELAQRLKTYAEWIKPHFEQQTPQDQLTTLFSQMAAQDLRNCGVTDQDSLVRYEYANPAWMSVAGLLRYWSKQAS